MTEKKSSTSEINKILFGGLEDVLNPLEFLEKQNLVIERAYKKIISDTHEGKINWERDFNDLSVIKYIAKARVLNNYGEEVKIPVSFQVESMEGNVGCFYLGSGKEVACKNTLDKEVKDMARKYFKLKRII